MVKYRSPATARREIEACRYREDHDQSWSHRRGQIDLLVQEGFCSNRTDLIRAAMRNPLAKRG